MFLDSLLPIGGLGAPAHSSLSGYALLDVADRPSFRAGVWHDNHQRPGHVGTDTFRSMLFARVEVEAVPWLAHMPFLAEVEEHPAL